MPFMYALPATVRSPPGLACLQNLMPAESFASLPEGAACSAMRAFSQMLKALTPIMLRIANSQ
jgi:hypothetical protein